MLECPSLTECWTIGHNCIDFSEFIITLSVEDVPVISDVIHRLEGFTVIFISFQSLA